MIQNQLIAELKVRGHGVLTPAKIEEVARQLTCFLNHAIDKYIAGQVEHGGSIEDRDLDKEIDQELIDLFFYHEARKKGKRLL